MLVFSVYPSYLLFMGTQWTEWREGVKKGLLWQEKGGASGSSHSETLHQAACFYVYLTLSSYITMGALISLAELQF